MKWLGIVLMTVGLIGAVLLRDVALPVSPQRTEVGGPHADIRQTQFVTSASVPMVLVFAVGLMVFLGRDKSSR